MHLIAHLLGLDNLSGSIYGFWSGFGSDLTEFGGLITIIFHLRKHHKEHMAELKKK